MPQQDPLGHLAMAVSHPRWIVGALHDALAAAGRTIRELAAALHADDQPPAVHLVARPGRIDRDELVAASGGLPAPVLAATGSTWTAATPARSGRSPTAGPRSRTRARSWSPPRWRWPRSTAPTPAGSIWPPAPVARPGCWVRWPRSAAPTVDAVEITPHRADLVRQTVRGLPVTVHTADGRDPGLPAASFDRVLLDAPCTGLGALRRRPEARWRRQPSDVGPLVDLQRELLASAARLVRPGGRDRLCDLLAAPGGDRRGDRPPAGRAWS